ncbi:hypothetical protein OHB31_00075 [Streptomyces microflavus]|uniref:hypothetical protein n=1 Tax=Streptomyces microflavus TaxID=1919 RepID=UPI002DD7AB44|nr:hypothetical protein [Streptomyces microflavus]WSA58653.1 hypothetical protein OHB31_00075 [Streptomyces microflavus]
MAKQLTTYERLALISKWKSPPGLSEARRLKRAEDMVQAAIDQHAAFSGVDIHVEAKGSYPNNTNVRGDSDVDIKVQLNECFYYDGRVPVLAGPDYEGPWTKDRLRSEVHEALTDSFGYVDAEHNIAFYIPEVLGSRPSIDVVPCFRYVLYEDAAPGGMYEGSVVFGGRDGKKVVNWPELQLANGGAKNTDTHQRYKFVVRVLKCVENELTAEGVIEALPSYLSECLVYNVPNPVFKTESLDDAVRASLLDIYQRLDSVTERRLMVEPNEVKMLFGADQKWDEQHALELIIYGWHYLSYGG